MDSEVVNNKKDDDSSDTDSSDDFEGEQLARVPDLQNKVTPSDQYKAVMLEEEKDIEKATDNLSQLEEDISILTERIDILRDVYFRKSSYQDITPLFIDGAPFLVDSSSLVACAIKESNYNDSNGGQTLHFIYICEKIIQLLSRKGGTCEVISFKEKSKVWHDAPQFSLAENILMRHLKNNTKVLTQEIDSISDPTFFHYIMEVQPNFIVLDFTFLDCLKNEFQSQEKFELYDSLFSIYGLIGLSLGLYCIDINSLQLGSNSFMSFVKSSDSKIASYREVLQKFCVAISNKIPNAIKGTDASEINVDKYKTKDVRRSVMVCVANSFINDNAFAKKEELAKAVLVYAAVLEVFPIEARCFNHQIKPIESLNKIVIKIVRSIDIYLKSNKFEGFDYSSVADLWHGNLFVEVISSIVSMKECNNLGSTLDKVYEEYMLEFNELTGLKLQKYPISLNEVIEDLNFEEYVRATDENVLFSRINGALPVINNELFKTFCKEICSSTEATDDSNNYCHAAVLTNLKWQNTARLTGVIDRIPNDNMEALVRLKYKKIVDPERRRKITRKVLDRHKASYAHYMDMYGSNLEGKTLERRAIVCENPTKKPQKNQKSQKKDKISKGAAKLIEDNNLKKEKKLQEEENVNYLNFKKQYKSNSSSGKSYEENLGLINHVINNMKSDLYYGKMMIYKVEMLFYLWEEECKKFKRKEDRDLSRLKELFLAIRDLVSCAQKESSLLGERERAKIGKKVCQLGFKDLAQKCSLPVIEDCQGNVDVSVNESCVRFQMVHLGPELLRKIEGDIDLRVEGFIPDQWQRDMFDAIDKRQSALIVAPTSSGKTYASYYCMEKVLRESNDGKVVYVAPTKALVNQVAATVYSRFKGKAGIVYGVLTKDYQVNAFECQVLVTVPECLETLFMSPEFHDWTKQLRYAIFDEVHCLTNMDNGVTWERCLMMTPCPFLALSATIQNPEGFHSWMQKFEKFKKELDPNIGSRVVLIVHSERHNDLVKHVYESNKGLQHIHPVSHLTNRVMNAHEGIPKHIYLAPGEMIELYDVLVEVAGKDNSDLKDLEPEKYFAQFESGFIFRNDAKKYESKMRKILEDWFTNKRELFDETVVRFRAQISDYESSNKRLAQFITSIKSFVELLKSRCMLPAILFSYDREKCEILGQYVTDVYKEEEDNAPKTKKKQIVAVNDDDDFDDRDERPLRKNKVKATSGKKEEHRRKLGDVELNPVGLTECDIQFSVRNVVSLSVKDLQFIENRLWRKGLRKKSPAIEMFRRGVGVHHSGVPTILRNTVEMLFRMKFLNVVFATGTLALGVHMPCKTVVILGDSPLLNTLEFHQISGRAGRRGFDKTGDVIFFGLDSKKVQSLQTSKLPKINGNYPLTVTTVLRFFCLYSRTKAENEKDEDKEKRLVLNRILTVLNESLLYQAYPDLRTQMKYYFGFSCHFLMSLGMLHAESGRIHLLTNLINLIPHHEQGILAFVYLLKIGFFHKLCTLNDNHVVSEKACDTIVIILCYLFTNIPFSRHQIVKDEKDKSVDIKLPSLPPDAAKALQSYNNIVKRSFTKYYKNVAKFNVEKFGKDEKLPISKKMFKGRCSDGDFGKDGASSLESMIAKNSVLNTVCSVFAGLSGQTDDDLYIENVVIGNVREEVFSNYKCIPLVELDVPLNSFAYNFYKHGIIRPIIRDHHLKPGQDYTCLLDFSAVLKHIGLSLNELQWVNEDGRDVLFGIRKTFNHIMHTFHDSFNRAYHEGKSN